MFISLQQGFKNDFPIKIMSQKRDLCDSKLVFKHKPNLSSWILPDKPMNIKEKLCFTAGLSHFSRWLRLSASPSLSAFCSRCMTSCMFRSALHLSMSLSGTSTRAHFNTRSLWSTPEFKLVLPAFWPLGGSRNKLQTEDLYLPFKSNYG